MLKWKESRNKYFKRSASHRLNSNVDEWFKYVIRKNNLGRSKAKVCHNMSEKTNATKQYKELTEKISQEGISNIKLKEPILDHPLQQALQ